MDLLYINATIKFKKLTKDAIPPKKSRIDDAGYDLYSNEEVTLYPNQRITVKTGIALEIPDEWVGLIWPRSGLAVKNGIDVLAGVIDSSYRGEIMVCLYNTSDEALRLPKGSKIAQILFQRIPHVSLMEFEDLSETDRGEKGFGSSGV